MPRPFLGGLAPWALTQLPGSWVFLFPLWVSDSFSMASSKACKMPAWCRLAGGAFLKSKLGLHSVSSRAESCVRRSIFALLVLTTTAHAQLAIFSYDQLERLAV